MNNKILLKLADIFIQSTKVDLEEWIHEYGEEEPVTLRSRVENMIDEIRLLSEDYFDEPVSIDLEEEDDHFLLRVRIPLHYAGDDASLKQRNITRAFSKRFWYELETNYGDYLSLERISDFGDHDHTPHVGYYYLIKVHKNLPPGRIA